MRYGVRTSVRATDVWHSVCAEQQLQAINSRSQLAAYRLPNLIAVILTNVQDTRSNYESYGILWEK